MVSCEVITIWRGIAATSCDVTSEVKVEHLAQFSDGSLTRLINRGAHRIEDSPEVFPQIKKLAYTKLLYRSQIQGHYGLSANRFPKAPGKICADFADAITEWTIDTGFFYLAISCSAALLLVRLLYRCGRCRPPWVAPVGRSTHARSTVALLLS